LYFHGGTHFNISHTFLLLHISKLSETSKAYILQSNKLNPEHMEQSKNNNINSQYSHHDAMVYGWQYVQWVVWGDFGHSVELVTCTQN